MTWLDVYLGKYKWYRKVSKKTWYKHEFTKDALEITFVPKKIFWATWGKLNRYTNVISIEDYR